MNKIYISSKTALYEDILEEFLANRHLAEFRPLSASPDEDEVFERLGDATAIIAGPEPYSRRVLTRMPNLKVISRTGVGYDAIDVECATERGVAVCTTPGANERTVADLTIGLMLSCARGIVQAHNGIVESAKFQRPPAIDFWGKTVGLIGCGAIGKHVARRAQSFDCRLLIHDMKPDLDWAAEVKAKYVSLEDLLRESDFISIHVPLNTHTRHLINAERIATMKPSAYVINTARGGIVDEDALSDALKRNLIAGAAIDVFSKEPLDPDSPLRELSNVILTPHMAGITQEAMRSAALMAAENIHCVLAGRTPPHRIN